MTVEEGPAQRDGWSARTWLLLILGFWVLRAVAVAAGQDNVGAAFLLLAIVCVAGLVWRLLRGR
ncbi:hypothetical protein [Janibacter terrae]|uniref:hypothetical protein n=1 Tax=Janibacter terrae TaxID=103817 RepID=UPI000832B8A4|nr:hypothetical protein [Janibacter terrae]